MKLRVLGCSGGIGGRHLRTTSFLVDHDILLDAGSGVAELSVGELAAIDHVFLTHAHLDHVLALPLMIVGHLRRQREIWLVGAALIAVVVAKLFFVELGNRGGLERIISFIGVGVLLLVVGYFAPLPPRKAEPEQVNA